MGTFSPLASSRSNRRATNSLWNRTCESQWRHFTTVVSKDAVAGSRLETHTSARTPTPPLVGAEAANEVSHSVVLATHLVHISCASDTETTSWLAFAQVRGDWQDRPGRPTCKTWRNSNQPTANQSAAFPGNPLAFCVPYVETTTGRGRRCKSNVESRHLFRISGTTRRPLCAHMSTVSHGWETFLKLGLKVASRCWQSSDSQSSEKNFDLIVLIAMLFYCQQYNSTISTSDEVWFCFVFCYLFVVTAYCKYTTPLALLLGKTWEKQ